MTTPDQRRTAGFTLIELMVTIAVAAVLLVIAAPSFVAFQRNSELTSAANSFVAALGAARGEAMKRGRQAVVVPRADNDWTTGWTVFVDTDNNQQFNGSDILIVQQGTLASYFTATGQGTAQNSPAYIMFNPSGYTQTSGSVFQSATLKIERNDISGTAKTQQTRIVVIAKTGRARACQPATDTTCTTSASE
ncbi:MAG TPA: GspH/FimT family pseudopilin [Paraburkholderia sp.]|uniref:GspH/FimT family pseudopilin n=1 Tax=Variovorax sp. Varisp62 TaxID=3243049 RepID=UPI002F2132B0